MLPGVSSRAHVTDFHSCIRKRAGPSVNVPCGGLQCGGGSGRGIVEIYNCSLARQKWSHEIGQIAFLVNARNGTGGGAVFDRVVTRVSITCVWFVITCFSRQLI